MSLLPERLPAARALAAVGLEPAYPEIRRTESGAIDYDSYLLQAHRLRSEAGVGALHALGRRIATGYAAWVRAIRDQRERRRALKELLRLDDNALRDIGLSRAGVYYALDHGREDIPEPSNLNAKPARSPHAA